MELAVSQDALELVLQGDQVLFAGTVEHGVKPLVPLADADEQADGRDDRHGQREHDAEQDPVFARAVDLGRLDQLIGQALDEGAHDQDVEGGDAARQDVDQEVVHQAVGAVGQERRDQAAAERTW